MRSFLEGGERVPLGRQVVAPLVSSKRVLVVDDDDELRELLAEALIDDGYEVITARNGAEAFDYVRHRRRQLDVVLLDLMMPIMDGRTFLHACRSLPGRSRIPVVVLSAAYRVQSLAAELGPNVRATLVKPYDLAVVLSLVACLTSRTIS
jgi:CheY-like chemotaxis protein